MFARLWSWLATRRSAPATTPVVDEETSQVEELEAEIERLNREGESISIEVRDLKAKVKELEGERDCLAVELRLQQGKKWLTQDEASVIVRWVATLRSASGRLKDAGVVAGVVADKELKVLEGLLTRSPIHGTVIHPGPVTIVGDSHQRAWQETLDSIHKHRDSQWESALTVAGVPLEKRK